VKLIVIAKEPRPGRVKTRLCPPCDPDEAAAIAAASLSMTLAAVRDVRFAEPVLALEGDVGPWLPSGFRVIPQRGTGLDERLAAAVDDAGPGPTLLVGMDTPQVDADELTRAARALIAPGVDAVLGLAVDGGWWAIGLCRPDPRVFLGVPMSTSVTGLAQLARLRLHGRRVAALPTVRDVDTFDDALEVSRQVPRSPFGVAVGRVGDRVALAARGAR
jgi:glycosyltransferase A (GT-A) superfamily protein (DUF2064 family)